MGKEQMLQRLQSLSDEDKSMLLEKFAFCKLADVYDFENYFRVEELNHHFTTFS